MVGLPVEVLVMFMLYVSWLADTNIIVMVAHVYYHTDNKSSDQFVLIVY